MTFLALLTKELRLRLRRERTIWIILLAVLLMGLPGWSFINRYANFNGNGTMTLNDIGTYLYMLLSLIQLILIVFITPAFTATTVNGEKERQTFDLLLCSRLSAFALIGGKLSAGLVNALLLIAASTPLFSLVFFFSSISLLQIISTLLVLVSTALFIGAFGLFCSTLINRPATSTAVAYMASILWIFLPLILSIMLYPSGNWFQTLSLTGQSPLLSLINLPTLLLIWNPIAALINTYPIGATMSKYIILHDLQVSPWLAYTCINVLATGVLFLFSAYLIRPTFPRRLYRAVSRANLASNPNGRK